MSARARNTGRLGERFAALAARGEKGLVTYLTAYDPGRAESLDLLASVARAGADVLEVGVPWSDPSADGPVIQRAMLRGHAAGASLRGVLDLVADLRVRVDTPIVLFGYYNPILCMGHERFAHAAHEAGVDGVLVVDLPREESDALDLSLREAAIDRVPLIAPMTSPARAAYIASGPASGGFAYYVGLTGTTGAGHLDIDDVARRTSALVPGLPLPLAVGFGVKDRETARALASLPSVAAVVVGSALVVARERGEDVVKLVHDLREGLLSVGK